MDKKLIKFGRDGMRGLPPGFRFEPTEEELVFEYLKCKVLCSALPASIIPEIDLSNFDPWDLPVRPGGEWEEEKYVFSNVVNKKEYLGGSIWTTPSGYWKAKLGCEKKIVSSSSNMMMRRRSTNSNSNSSVVTGMKKTLVFYANTNTNKGRRGSIRTGWVMHEYRLMISATTTSHQPHQPLLNNMDKWVLCRIFWNKSQSQSQSNNHNSLHHLQYYSLPTNDPDADADALSDNSVSSTASSTSTSTTNFFTSPTTTSTTMSLHQNSDDDFSAS